MYVLPAVEPHVKERIHSSNLKENERISMKLNTPFQISPRLLPGLRVGQAWIQLEYSKRPGTGGRLRYKWTIDLPDGSEHSGDDLQSGCGGGTLQEGFCSLLSFLTAAAESWRRSGKEGENSDLFPHAVSEWAVDNSDELQMLDCELSEAGQLIEP